MKNMPIRNAIWRSRAVAIIGFLVMLLAIFPGLPSALENTLFVVFGLLVLSFGFAGSRHKSYAPSDLPIKVTDQFSEKVAVTAQEIETPISIPAENSSGRDEQNII